MKQLFTLFAVLMVTVPVFAQQEKYISGKVEGNGQPLASATVILVKAADSSVVKMSISNDEGEYRFDHPGAGRYRIKFSAVGFKETYSEIFEMDQESKIIPVLTLETLESELDAVVVVKQKPLIEQKIDRMVVNVGASLTSGGSNALEVLEKAPGVVVDQDGNISLKGKQGVMILIDGRPTHLSGQELANLLKGMTSDQLEQVEIMTNPPAKYDASGKAGVINLVMKGNKKQGVNGSVTVSGTQGIYPRWVGAGALNFKNNKINFFSNASASYSSRYNALDLSRKYLNDNGDLLAIFDQNAFHGGNYSTNNVKLGADYYLNTKTTLGIVLSRSNYTEDGKGDNLSYLKSPIGVLDSLVKSTYSGHVTYNTYSVNLNLRKKLDSLGKEFSIDLDYINYTTDETSTYRNSTLTPEGQKKYDEWLKAILPFNINIYSARLDYVFPVKDKIKIEAGLKTGMVDAKNKAYYYEMPVQDWEIDYKRTNFFNYNEKIHAAYLSYSQQVSEKFALKAGLRYEYTDYGGDQFGNPTRTDSSFTNAYGSLFPTLYLSYTASEDHTFSVNTGRRISRPRYQNMNPFMYFIDKFTYGQGNPFLKPEFAQNFEFSHIYKGKFTTTLNYGVTNDLFAETFDQPEDSTGYSYISISKQGNIGKSTGAGIAFSASISIGSWNNATFYANYNYEHYKGIVNGDYLDRSAGVVNLNMNNQIKIAENWNAEVSGTFHTKGVFGQVVYKQRGWMDLGVSKKLWDGKGNVRLSIRDVLNTNSPRADINFKNTLGKVQNHWDTRTVTLRFQYNFGKNKNGGQTRRNQLEELDRLN